MVGMKDNATGQSHQEEGRGGCADFPLSHGKYCGKGQVVHGWDVGLEPVLATKNEQVCACEITYIFGDEFRNVGRSNQNVTGFQ